MDLNDSIAKAVRGIQHPEEFDMGSRGRHASDEIAVSLSKHLTGDDIRAMEDRFYRSRCGDVPQESNRDVDLKLKAFIFEEGMKQGGEKC